MMKLTNLLVLVALLPTGALAQSRTFYDASGRVSGRSTTDSGGTTTYDAGGRVTGRTSTSGNTTTVYDASGRKTGSVTTNRSK